MISRERAGEDVRRGRIAADVDVRRIIGVNEERRRVAGLCQ